MKRTGKLLSDTNAQIDLDSGNPLYVVTDQAVYLLREPGEHAEPQRLSPGPGIRCLAAAPNVQILAFQDGTLLRRNTKDTATIARVDEPVECLLILHEDPLEMLVGTLEARLYRFLAGELRRVTSFDRLSCRSEWHTPWGGPPSVRSLAGTSDGTLYADIHVGSIMRSDDFGHNWQPVEPTLHEDVHQVATAPSKPERVYANTAKGVFLSDDRGHSWEHRAADLDNRYGRAVAVAPNDPDLLLASVSDGPHGDNVHGQLYLSSDAGVTWQHLDEGLPRSTPENINTHHVAFTSDDRAWALAGHNLYLGQNRATYWAPYWDVPAEPLMIASTCRALSD